LNETSKKEKKKKKTDYIPGGAFAYREKYPLGEVEGKAPGDSLDAEGRDHEGNSDQGDHRHS